MSMVYGSKEIDALYLYFTSRLIINESIYYVNDYFTSDYVNSNHCLSTWEMKYLVIKSKETGQLKELMKAATQSYWSFLNIAWNV